LSTLTDHLDLRGGKAAWTADAYPPPSSAPLPGRPVDIAIVGAGVMGAMLAERLASAGQSVALLDRRPPGHGSTAASTALVMWAADVPLSHLAEEIGLEAAAQRWHRVYRAVQDLGALIRTAGLECEHRASPELYLEGDLLDEDGLRQEAEMRQDIGLPSEFLDAAAVSNRFGISARAALLSQGTFSVDPVKLTLGLLARAIANNASVSYSVDVVGVEDTGDDQILTLSEGHSVRARRVILATGYERSLFLPSAFSLGSSYAIATAPGNAPLWREEVMIWEASDSYLYTRTTVDGRIIAGGEDEEFSDAKQRDEIIPQKSDALREKLAALTNSDPTVDTAWAATFGSSPDGLPAIGRVRGRDNLWLAAGFGGNGVSFATLAASIIGADIDGNQDSGAKAFDPYRFEGE
jgi:glycine/D-amino acid oxidase-like deaminating enzyme